MNSNNDNSDKPKKKIFIGSSSEATGILDKLVTFLEDEYDVIRWDKSMTNNKSTLDCLIENAIKVDEAIFIGTADNEVIATDAERAQREGVLTKHRDNVVFEFGLFLGMLGRHDCVYLVDNSTLKDMMSDYKGITVTTFKRDSNDSLSDAIKEIKKGFKEFSNRDVNLFPSASLAAAYYKNFIQPILRHYSYNKGCIDLDGKKKYKKCSITIILPTTITEDVNIQFDEIKRKKNITTKPGIINYVGRQRGIGIDTRTTDKELKIIDFPTTIAGIHHAVHALLPKEKDKTVPDYEAIMRRELDRFKETLELHVKEDPCKSIKVEIIKEDSLLIDAPVKKKLTAWGFLRK